MELRSACASHSLAWVTSFSRTATRPLSVSHTSGTASRGALLAWLTRSIIADHEREAPKPQAMTVAAFCHLFLGHIEKHHPPDTFGLSR